MPSRAEILDTLAASQTQVLAFFHRLSPEDLERPVTASDYPGAAPWRAKDHLAHLAQSERNIQRVMRAILAREDRDTILRMQYPEGRPLPAVLGDLDALTPEEGAQLLLDIASINQAAILARYDDPLEALSASYVAARQVTLDLLRQFTDDQLAAPAAMVTGDEPASVIFAGRAGHAAEHMASVEDGLRQGL